MECNGESSEKREDKMKALFYFGLFLLSIFAVNTNDATAQWYAIPQMQNVQVSSFLVTSDSIPEGHHFRGTTPGIRAFGGDDNKSAGIRAFLLAQRDPFPSERLCQLPSSGSLPW